MKNKLTKATFEEAEKELQSLLFPVKLGKVNILMPQEEVINADLFKGIINTENNYVFSVVSDQYKLISNQEALNWGIDIFAKLFKDVNPDEIKPYRVKYPKTYSYCHIFLVHENVNFEVFEQDTWLPFIKISNSYNKTFALSYQLGFVRKLCKNGIIYKKDVVELKAVHNKYENFDWTLNYDFQLLKKTESDFVENMKMLKNFQFDPKYIVPLICMILNCDFELNKELNMEISDKKIKKDEKEFSELKTIINNLSEKYFKEMGQNGYAVFNILTDLISNESENIKKLKRLPLLSEANNYKPTKWMIDFIDINKKLNFNIEEYLKDYLKYAA